MTVAWRDTASAEARSDLSEVLPIGRIARARTPQASGTVIAKERVPSCSLRDLRGLTVRTREHLPVGKLADAWVDPVRWTVRYFVLGLGRWPLSRRVLLAPLLVAPPDPLLLVINIAATRRQLQHVPRVQPAATRWRDRTSTRCDGRWRVRDIEELRGRGTGSRLCSIARYLDRPVFSAPAAGGPVGYLADLLVDSRDWVVRRLVVDVSKGPLTPRPVVIDKRHLSLGVRRWAARLQTDLSAEQLAHAPPYRAGAGFLEPVRVHPTADRRRASFVGAC